MRTNLKAYIMIGMPASGKSSLAHRMVRNWPNHVEVNLDYCRSIINGNQDDQGNIQLVLELRELLLKAAIANNKHVIISDTNLAPGFRETLIHQLRYLGFKTIIKIVMTTLPEVCMERNNSRPNPVPEDIMLRFEEMSFMPDVTRDLFDDYMDDTDILAQAEVA